ncbi:glycosyltransferase family 2 protein [Patescibacteria group bacterium]|nr:glycosyltransferase family 2 protein [Patescibacteria group bacterium]
MKDTWIVIPAYNEEKTLAKVLRDLREAGYENTLVVDDGSIDETLKIAEEHAAATVSHKLNRGLGGALGTGIEGAVRLGAEYIVTFDGDGQHSTDDLQKVLAPLRRRETDVVIGSRLLNPDGMPWYRRAQNWVANMLTFVLFGVWTTDSQSGLRAFNRKAAQAITIRTNRMEVSSEIIREIGYHGLRFKEVPIQAIYTDYSLSKGQNIFVGLKTLAKLIMHRIAH